MQHSSGRTAAKPMSLNGTTLAESDPANAEVAQYIANLAGELADMARQSQLPILAYLLDMAHVEAAAGQSDHSARAA